MLHLILWFLEVSTCVVYLQDVNARRTKDNDGRQPIAIGHLSHSGDLKKESCATFDVSVSHVLIMAFKSQLHIFLIYQFHKAFTTWTTFSWKCEMYSLLTIHNQYIFWKIKMSTQNYFVTKFYCTHDSNHN